MDSMNVGSIHRTSSNTIGFYAPKASQHKRNIHKEYNFVRFRKSSLKHFFKSIEGGLTYQQCNRKHIAKAGSEPSFESDIRAYDAKNILDSVKNFLNVFYKFCSSYPYARINTVLSIFSASLLAVEKLSDISPLFFIGVLRPLVAYLLLGIYVNGLNQMCDIEIDKINKPYLPFASGKISFATGATITGSFLILSFWQGWAVGSWPLIWALVSSFTLWTAYSVNLPFLRWKRYPILAGMVTLATLAFINPIAIFFHMQTFVFKRPAVFSRPLIFNTVSMSLFSIAVALFKDIPDIEGDQAFGIRSFAARLGQKRVFWICISILEMACGLGLLAGATSFHLWSKIIMVLGHVILASATLYRARSVDLKSKASIMSFYIFIWRLMCVENLLMPLIR